jgi:ABC-2 type transport system ATP-binding protein
VHEPAVLILDEPTVGLDPRQVVEIRELIRDLRGRTTVLLSTHILSEVSSVCDRVVIIDRGRVVAEDSAAGLARAQQRGERTLLRVDGPPAQVAAARRACRRGAGRRQSTRRCAARSPTGGGRPGYAGGDMVGRHWG